MLKIRGYILGKRNQVCRFVVHYLLGIIMFRKKVRSIAELLPEFLRNEGLETPLLQKRLLDSWDTVVGASISVYCADKFIKNQTLYVKILNPALRADLTMHRSILVRRLNEQVGALVITDIRFY